jgi:hypothetical protein
MADTLVPLNLPPGLYRNGTVYQSKGRWYSSNLVRFFSGTIQPVGGWTPMQDDAKADLAPLAGVPRGVIGWRGAAGDKFLAAGTTQKLYVLKAGVLHDITPAGFAVGAVDSGGGVTVTAGGQYNAGAYGNGAYGSGSSTASITDADIWQLDNFGDYFVGVCTSDKTLYLWSGDVAVAATPIASPPTTGTAVATTGTVTFSSSQGGRLAVGDTITVLAIPYVVQTFNGTTGATVLPASSFVASPFTRTPQDVPTAVTGVVVTPERFLVTLGWSNGAPSVRGVAWASQETTDVWHPLITNSAGDFDLTTSGRILCGHRTRNETLLWTDVDMHVMSFIGGPLVYRFAQAGDKCGAISPRSPVVVDTMAMWMGTQNFYMYDGFVKPLPCEVQDYVFGDFNQAQAIKVWGQSVAEFGEVWWFYPSGGSMEIDRYVSYNYWENHWSVGQLARTAGCDAGALTHPVMITPTGIVYEHENGWHRPSPGSIESAILQENGLTLITENGTLIIEEQLGFSPGTNDVPYLESGPVQIGEGDHLMSLQRIIPDEKTLGDVAATIYSSLHPTDTPEDTHGPYALANETDIRVNARQIRIRLEENQTVPSSWRVGQLRFGARPSSRR